MQVAIEEAREGMKNNHGGPFGAVVVLSGEIIGQGHNKVCIDLDPTQHGEIVAIRSAYEKVNARPTSERLYRPIEGAVMYTTCYPCPMCIGACLWSGITKIIYGCTSHDAKQIGFDDELFYGYLALNEKA
jgi:guanine deaminase